MQKLPEASDRNRERHMRKEKGLSRQKEKSDSLSAETSGVTTLELTGGGCNAFVFRQHIG